MISPSLASEVLRAVVDNFPAPDDGNGDLRLIDSWTEAEDTICVVYEGWWVPGKVGPRRRIDGHVPTWQEIANILDGEFGEPPGLMVEGVMPDVDGVIWWEGDRPEWRQFPPGSDDCT